MQAMCRHTWLRPGWTKAVSGAGRAASSLKRAGSRLVHDPHPSLSPPCSGCAYRRREVGGGNERNQTEMSLTTYRLDMAHRNTVRYF